jgi:ATP-binding cassette subfamily B protein/subfamily B ATP-binding cassette protein MsbA
MGKRLPLHQSHVVFRDVCFSYEPGRAVLSNVNLTVPFGETIALVGRNGCGKTTLLSLLPRFFDPEHGSVLIDDIDIRTANLRSLRRQIAIVTQETILFDDTIARNIAYGRRHASREQIEEAARKAFAHDFIEKLPRGYETRVGELARSLSGGERQRIALARAILRNPTILLLDEFSSQIDAESEAKIHIALKEFAKGRTTILITHRLHTLEVADRIVVLEGGRIEAVGTHEQLLALSETYRGLHDARRERKAA